MSNQKEFRKLIQSLEDAGYEVRLKEGSTHYQVTDPQKIGRKFTLPCSPSDYRGFKNALSQLKNAGYRFTFKSRRYSLSD